MHIKQINPYLSFKGNCEAAFTFYAQCFGVTLGTIFRYGGSPMEHQVPSDWQDKVMHTGLTIGALELNGADVAPESYEEPKGFSRRGAEWCWRWRGRSGRRGLGWSSIASASRG